MAGFHQLCERCSIMWRVFINVRTIISSLRALPSARWGLHSYGELSSVMWEVQQLWKAIISIVGGYHDKCGELSSAMRAVFSNMKGYHQ